jgi:type I restriction enzyme, S subunit
MGLWARSTVSDLVRDGAIELQTGPFGSQLHAHEYQRVGVPVVPTEAITDGRIDHTVTPKVSAEKATELERHRLLPDDLLFARRGVQATGKVALVREAEAGWICGTGAIRLRVIAPDVVLPKFLAALFSDPASINWFKHNAIGATMPNLNPGVIGRFPLLLPSSSEQAAIASTIFALDDKIELNRRMNETLEAMARAIFKDWFVDFGPTRANMEGRAPYLAPDIWSLFPDRLDDEGKPEGWQVRSVYEIADVVYGAPFSSKLFNSEERGRPLIRIRDLPNETPGVWTPEDHPKGCVVRAGDIVVGMDGEFRAYLWGGDDAWLNQRVCVFKPKIGFSAAFVRNSIFAPLAEVEATEIATTVIHLGKNDIDRFAVIIPREKLVERFNALCQPLYDMIVANKRESRTLATTRDFLLPKLMSGEVRVKDAEKLVGEPT